MIKLFRKIRKNLLVESKTGDYFKYAIGEIILVVIGILIALQINNWNNQRLLRNKEEKLLEQVKIEVNSLLGDIKVDIKILELGVNSHLRILETITNDAAYDNKMCFDFHWLIKDEYVYPIRAAYDALKEEGLDLVQNDSIKELLQGTYEYVLPRISKETAFYPDLEVFYQNYYHKNFKPNTDTTLVFKQDFEDFKLQYPYTSEINGKEIKELIGYVPINFEDLKQDTEFQVLLRQSWQYRTFKLSRYTNAKYIIEDLITAIENEF